MLAVLILILLAILFPGIVRATLAIALFAVAWVVLTAINGGP